MAHPTELILTKLEVATAQLERALVLFLNESDLVSSVTLAGASEEILGKLLEQCGKKHALSSRVEATVEIARIIQNREANPKAFATLANEVCNGLKHIADGQPVTVTCKASIDIIGRAVENYFALTDSLSPSMSQFLQVAYAR
ncbi:MAG: hypothetical protein WBQ69_01795 [Gallionella sp.]